MAQHFMELENLYGAHNYHPLPIVLRRGEGVYLWDIQDRQYIDLMSAYSAVSHGHRHPRIIQALLQQAQQLTMVSRAFYNDQLGPFLEKACLLFKFDQALPMNSGAEAVETALKAARKWAYQVKGVNYSQAEIISAGNNFHGRTIAVLSMSTEAQYREGFGPFPEGFKNVPYGDLNALSRAINENTAAFIIEPIQGEAGIIVPPLNYLKQAAELCKQHRVLFIADEIQSGLGRTGQWLACQHEAVQPDAVILGKALGGGVLPVSMFLANKEVMSVFTPGDHGSTFGGNPLAAAVGLEALRVIEDEGLVQRSAQLGEYFLKQLLEIDSPLIKQVRGRGLFIGLEIDPDKAPARAICMRLLQEGVLSKETHHTVVRLAPPLVITQNQIDEVVAKIKKVLTEEI